MCSRFVNTLGCEARWRETRILDELELERRLRMIPFAFASRHFVQNFEIIGDVTPSLWGFIETTVPMCLLPTRDLP